MSRWQNCWRYSVLVYVVFFCVTGIAELVTISYILLRRYSLRYFVGPVRISLYASYIAPALVAATAVVGWNGVIRKHRTLLKIFSVLATITVCMEIAGSVWTFIEKEDLGRITTDVLTAKFKPSENNGSVSMWWNTLQTQLMCCGIHGPSDYRNSHNAIPFSCCEPSSGTGLCGHMYSRGCLIPFIDLLSLDFVTVSLCLLITAICQVPGVFLSWALANRLDQPINL